MNIQRLITAIAIALCAIAATAQTKHTVARGETLQSIAKAHNISVEELADANPGVDKLFYVGLILNIPEATGAKAAGTAAYSAPASGLDSLPAPADEDAQPAGENTAPGPGFKPVLSFEYGFLEKNKGTKGTNYTYGFTIGANYYFFTEGSGLFAGARIGYNSANYNSRIVYQGSYMNNTSTVYCISVPVSAGYSIPVVKDHFFITPYAGIDFNFGIAGSVKQSGRANGESYDEKYKIEKHPAIDARVGLALSLNGLGLGVAYIIPVEKWQKAYFGKEAYCAINLNFGF